MKARALLLFLLLTLPLVNAISYQYIINVKENGSGLLSVVTTIDDAGLAKELLNETKLENFKEYQKRLHEQNLVMAGFKISTDKISVSLSNTSVKVTYSAEIENIAKFYSYDETWEIIVDPTFGFAVPKVSKEVSVEGVFIVNLPEKAVILDYPKNYSKSVGKSYFRVTSSVKGKIITVRSELKLEPNDNLAELFRDFSGYYIEYTFPVPKVSRTVEEVISLDGSGNATVRIEDERISTLVSRLGKENATIAIVRGEASYLTQRGIRVLKVLDAKVEGSRAEVVFSIKDNVRNVNGTYVYTFEPKLFLPHRFESQLSESWTVKILAKNAEAELPAPVEKEFKGNVLRLTAEKADDGIIVRETLFIPYGAKGEDVKKILKGISVKLRVKPTTATVLVTSTPATTPLNHSNPIKYVILGLVMGLSIAVAFELGRRWGR